MDNIGTIYITGVIGEETTLLDVIRQTKAQPTATEFLVKIDSVGGYVDEGFEIYDFLKNLEKPVHTFATQAYSIASVIYMAGERRFVSENANDVLMIHLPWMEVAGTFDSIEFHNKELKDAENRLVKFYSEAVAINHETIQALLAKETFLNATQCKELGFATEIKSPQKAVAKLNNKKEETSLMNEIQKTLNAIYNKVKGIKNELVLQDASGEKELVFADLEPTDVAEVGQMATVDGEPADGEFIMPDGSTLVFTKGELTEIKPKEEAPAEEEKAPENADDAPANEDEKDAKIKELEAKIIELQLQLDESATKDQVDKLIQIVDASHTNHTELQNKFNALAKQIGSDFTSETVVQNTSAIKAKDGDKPKFSIKRK